jgi:hypothetical protein
MYQRFTTPLYIFLDKSSVIISSFINCKHCKVSGFWNREAVTKVHCSTSQFCNEKVMIAFFLPQLIVGVVCVGTV